MSESTPATRDGGPRTGTIIPGYSGRYFERRLGRAPVTWREMEWDGKPWGDRTPVKPANFSKSGDWE